eukprot:CAMPEP_0195533296 /NCGR_PEP_ID=MMETSP0794_2-20130614/40198_1 /TAXON_ID=515487 /ORGANISM="Stephanopyxis turris, Strain CCMP 815" /LENGTH=184 /DNA_ID=CAMNT_0040665769 /DNA_START=53 /DNA_END=607 /DNA_ORIENTATION=-
MTAVQQSILDHDAYTWSLMDGQTNANAMPFLFNQNQCVKVLQQACYANSNWQTLPKLFGFSVQHQTQFLQLEQDLAFFLLVRGPYTYAGWGVWGMTWPFNAESSHGALPPLPHGVPLPSEFNSDYGVPLEVCHEIKPGVFHREWSRGTVELNCHTFQATIDIMAEEDGALVPPQFGEEGIAVNL